MVRGITHVWDGKAFSTLVLPGLTLLQSNNTEYRSITNYQV